MATRVFDGVKFCEQFLKKISQGTFLPSVVQINPAVGEEMFKQEGQDGPGSLTRFFEIALANFFWSLSEKNFYKNFFMSIQCKKPPFTNTMFIDRSKFQEQF